MIGAWWHGRAASRSWLATFAFGMMLPSMSALLSLDRAQVGLLGFANMMWCLVAVFLTDWPCVSYCRQP